MSETVNSIPDRKVSIFNQTVTLRKGSVLPSGHIPISAIVENGNPYTQVYTYDPSDTIIQPDGDKVFSLLEECLKMEAKRSNVFIRVFDSIVFVTFSIWRWFFKAVSFGALLGSIGNGVIGAFIAFSMVIVVGALGLQILIYLSPVIALSFFLKRKRDKKMEAAAEVLINTALALASNEQSKIIEIEPKTIEEEISATA